MSEEPPFVLQMDIEHTRKAAQRLFESVREVLQSRLPASADIRHVGATAVPGCLTKGDLDVVVRVPLQDFEQADTVLAEMLARNEGSTRTSTFSAFEDDARSPHLGVQHTVIGGPFDDFHLFVEALRNSPDLLQEYNALKRAHNGSEMADYRKAKDDFVERVLARLNANE